MVIRIVTKRENVGQISDGLDVGSTGLVDELDGDIKEDSNSCEVFGYHNWCYL